MKFWVRLLLASCCAVAAISIYRHVLGYSVHWPTCWLLAVLYEFYLCLTPKAKP